MLHYRNTVSYLIPIGDGAALPEEEGAVVGEAGVPPGQVGAEDLQVLRGVSVTQPDCFLPSRSQKSTSGPLTPGVLPGLHHHDLPVLGPRPTGGRPPHRGQVRLQAGHQLRNSP